MGTVTSCPDRQEMLHVTHDQELRQEQEQEREQQPPEAPSFWDFLAPCSTGKDSRQQKCHLREQQKQARQAAYGKHVHVRFSPAAEGDHDFELVDVTLRQFLANDILSLVKEFLPDEALLRCRLVCSAWASQDREAWDLLLACLKVHVATKPTELEDTAGVASQALQQTCVKAGGIGIIGGSAVFGLGTLVLIAALVTISNGIILIVAPHGIGAIGMSGFALAHDGITEGCRMVAEPYSIESPTETWCRERQRGFLTIQRELNTAIQQCGDPPAAEDEAAVAAYRLQVIQVILANTRPRAEAASPLPDGSDADAQESDKEED